MDRLDGMAAFAGVVETGSFTAAAGRLGRSRAAISKYVKELEDRFGAQLLNRTTRRVSPTETGLAFYEYAVRILADVAEAEAAVSQLQQWPRGNLKINAPMSFGTMYLGSLVAEFISRYPELKIQLQLNDRFVDVVEEALDLTIRIGELEDSSLVARRLCAARRVLCASPTYLARRGSPDHPAQLRRHDCLHYGNLASGSRWVLSGPDGEHSVEINGVLCANNGEVLRESAVAGLGIALLPVFIVAPQLKSGVLKQVLDGYSPSDMSVYAVYPPSRHLSAKVRMFIDFMAARFDPEPDWSALT